jgi:hypothetical protein
MPFFDEKQDLVEPNERPHPEVRAGLTSHGRRNFARTARPTKNTPESRLWAAVVERGQEPEQLDRRRMLASAATKLDRGTTARFRNNLALRGAGRYCIPFGTDTNTHLSVRVDYALSRCSPTFGPPAEV